MSLFRVFKALSDLFEPKPRIQDLAAKIENLETQIAQCRLDVTKCKMMVGLNRLTEVTAHDV